MLILAYQRVMCSLLPAFSLLHYILTNENLQNKLLYIFIGSI